MGGWGGWGGRGLPPCWHFRSPHLGKASTAARAIRMLPSLTRECDVLLCTTTAMQWGIYPLIWPKPGRKTSPVTSSISSGIGMLYIYIYISSVRPEKHMGVTCFTSSAEGPRHSVWCSCLTRRHTDMVCALRQVNLSPMLGVRVQFPSETLDFLF